MSENTSGEQNEYDLVVIGAGPGGYTGAIRAAQLGLHVAVVEKGATLGGTCLNVGCIPSKALLDSSEHYSMAKHGDFAAHGLKFQKVDLDLSAMMSRKAGVVKELTDGIQFLFNKNKIEWVKGVGRITGAHQVSVQSESGARVLQAKNIMIATGSVPVELPFLKFDGKRVMSSTEALSLPEVPKHLVVVGGGVIGLELGSVWARLGAKVTVIEFAPMIAGAADQAAAKQLLRILKKQGIEFLLSCKVTKSEVSAKGVTLEYEDMSEKKTATIEADYVLVSTGRRAYADKLGLETVGIQVDKRGCVEIDDHFRTAVPNIYAVGDVVRGPMLAHKAEEEGVAVAEIIAGRAGHVNYETVPSVIYTWPELAWVGWTEEQAKQSGRRYKVGQFPFKPNARAKAMGFTDGLCKIIADSETDRVLGVHILGPRASDMIAEAVVAMEFGGSSEDIARSFHAHPTLAEVVREAALAVDGRARQM
ncbi:MAG: dihydrolipoyl dehydrogenase [Bdellovibrionaceae bacterium]|nr:dihydrolipoyl dehydrogenase [Pseudobdellovibrionaceae bacterium]